MQCNVSTIYILSLGYLLLPVLLFFLTWLRFEVGIAAFVLLLAGAYSAYRHIRTLIPGSLELGWEHGVTAFLVFAFLLCTGNCGFFGATGVDIACRDAIYADLIRYPWPVIYEESGAILTYYLFFWLVPAGISSALGLGWSGSHVALFAWMYVGLLLTVWLLGDVLQARRGKLVFVCLLFLFWSGLNLLGMLPKSVFAKTPLQIDDYPGYNSWAFTGGEVGGYRMDYFIRTTFDGIANVYNQFISVCLGTVCFLRLQNRPSLFAFLGLLILPYSPCGFIGMFAVLTGMAAEAVWRRESRLREWVSPVNLCASFAILPVLYGYFFLNRQAVGTSAGVWYAPLEAYTLTRIGILILYYGLYFGVYLWLLDSSIRKTAIWRWLLLVLCVVPFFRVGKAGDFSWNASMGPYFILMVLVGKTLLLAWERRCFWGRSLVLAVLLGIAAMTPLMQFTTSLRACALERKMAVYLDRDGYHGSLANLPTEDLQNFLAMGCEDSWFYKYVLKHNRPMRAE